jgi:hypothetical protein
MTETPTPTEAEGRLEFCLRLTRAHATLTRRLDNALSGVHGLSFGDFMILHHLGRAPGLRLRRIDLAERLDLTPSGVTRSLLPLEKLGLVGRQPDSAGCASRVRLADGCRPGLAGACTGFGAVADAGGDAHADCRGALNCCRVSWRCWRGFSRSTLESIVL